jgi:hypothetical protein
LGGQKKPGEGGGHVQNITAGKSDRSEKSEVKEAATLGEREDESDLDTGTTSAAEILVPPSTPYYLTPGILPPDFDDGNEKPSVLVDANYHVLYKEYNLRRSKTFMTALKPPKKHQKETDESAAADTEPAKSIVEKRERSVDDSGRDTVAAKRLKIDEEVAEKKEGKDLVSPTSKTSPPKRGRKTSLSQQSKKSRGKKQACMGGSKGAGESDTEVLCGLCLRKDGACNLGFLFGPYKPVTTGDKDKLKSPSTEADGVAVDGEADAAASSPLWVHEDCAVWAPGVCLVRGKLLGLHEAVEDGKNLVGRVSQTCISQSSLFAPIITTLLLCIMYFDFQGVSNFFCKPTHTAKFCCKGP